ncbi:MAG: serine/threonine protein kinase, partial [Planctomycetes bacterium]|nr:serine/threonine protein kinase [Planctomycetota bacterium]
MSEVGGHSTRRLEHDLSVDRVRRLIVQRLSDGSSAGGPLDTRRLRVEFPGYESLIAAELAAREDVRHPGTILDEGTTDEGWPGTEPRQSEMAAGRSIGRYIVERTLGRGGMGVVYLARDPALDRTVVLKMVRPDQVDAEMVSRLESEARALARLNHPAICPIYDIVKEGSDKVGVVLPFIPGLPLRCQGAVDAYISFGTTRLLRESSSRANGEGAMTPSGVAKVKKTPIADATRLLERVARAVGTAHDVGLVHRDLKPDNIMIRPDGEPVIMDFGLASAPCGMPIEGSGSRSGTPAYMAPEQVRGTGPFDARTDVYALGVVLYEHLTGCRPFSSTSGREDLFAQILAGRPTPPRALRRDIPDDLEAVCLKAMDVRRESRFPSTREFEEELRRFRTGRSTRTAPVGLARIATRKARRHPVAALAVAAILVAMLLAAY